MQADSLPSEPPGKFLEPEGQGQILGLPPTTRAPMASYSLSPCLNFVTSEMGMTLIGDIDLVPTTSQVLPSELFTHHISRFPSATYFVEEESRAQRDLPRFTWLANGENEVSNRGFLMTNSWLIP